ncbi:hypothetical protein CCR82_00700 [Halochromatium salexigens]|uniref:Uncharacterized protein n=1 Tax=Halochromatium salexigens TaxID=49447 RepID=A0AAJ0UEE0_HALSE|nr:hypothetical protein [Halochromatium salexigens]
MLGSTEGVIGDPRADARCWYARDIASGLIQRDRLQPKAAGGLKVPLLGRQQHRMTALLQCLRDGVHGDDVAERAFGDDQDAPQGRVPLSPLIPLSALGGGLFKAGEPLIVLGEVVDELFAERGWQDLV